MPEPVEQSMQFVGGGGGAPSSSLPSQRMDVCEGDSTGARLPAGENELEGIIPHSHPARRTLEQFVSEPLVSTLERLLVLAGPLELEEGAPETNL